MVAVVALLSGCASDPVWLSEAPGVPGSGPAVTSTNKAPVRSPSDRLQVGEGIGITVTLQGSPDSGPKPWGGRIEDDGTITVPDVGQVKAAGLTTAELRLELQKRYELFYIRPTVGVNAGERFYDMVGEVRAPGPKQYLGKTDVVAAVAGAGGLTEFASNTLYLIHPTGETKEVDYRRAVRHPKENPQVYPGDKIIVKRRWL